MDKIHSKKFNMEALRARRLKEFTMIFIGTVIISIAINFMIKPNFFINGGLTGLLLLVQKMFDTSKYISFNTLYFVLNAFLLVVGYKVLGSRDFIVKTVFASVSISILNFLWDYLIAKSPTLESFIVHDILLVTVYASLLIGAGVGIVIRNGGSTGGLDIPQKILNKEFKLPYLWSILAIDGSVIVLGFVSFGIEKGMYWLISIYIIGKVIDALSIGFSSATAAYIVTARKDSIIRLIQQSIDRGVTILPCTGGYSSNDYNMLCVVCSNRREYNELREIISLYDQEAFIFATRAVDIEGLGFGKKRN